jgi:hypothetical protein
MGYSHTQHGWWHLLLCAVAVFLLTLPWIDPNVPPLMMMVMALLFFAVAQLFRTLTVEDAGDALQLRFGPLPLISKRIEYRTIRAVELGRLSLLDGWGIHWVPGRGWTYSLWGFDCVILRLDRRTIRIGTDDAQHLASFLREKVG